MVGRYRRSSTVVRGLYPPQSRQDGWANENAADLETLVETLRWLEGPFGVCYEASCDHGHR